MDKNTPREIQYCLKSGATLQAFPFPDRYGTTYFDCEALVQRFLGTYWRVEGGALIPKHKSSKSNPLPELVRVMSDDGSVFCQFSIDDMLSVNLCGAIG